MPNHAQIQTRAKLAVSSTKIHVLLEDPNADPEALAIARIDAEFFNEPVSDGTLAREFVMMELYPEDFTPDVDYYL